MNNKNSQISFDRSFGMDFNLLRLVGAWSKDTRTAECASSNTLQGKKTPIFANVSEINATTYLQFATPKKGKAELSVFNTQGKEVYHRNFDANAGNNILEIDLSASTKSEMYYYLIQTPTEPVSGRFIKISY